MTTFAIRFNVRTSRASERRAELAPAMPNAAENGQSQCFCFIFDVDLVVGHREGNPVSFFSLLPNPMKMITFAYKKTKPDSLTSQGLPGFNTAKVVLFINTNNKCTDFDTITKRHVEANSKRY